MIRSWRRIFRDSRLRQRLLRRAQRSHQNLSRTKHTLSLHSCSRMIRAKPSSLNQRSALYPVDCLDPISCLLPSHSSLIMTGIFTGPPPPPSPFSRTNRAVHCTRYERISSKKKVLACPRAYERIGIMEIEVLLASSSFNCCAAQLDAFVCNIAGISFEGIPPNRICCNAMLAAFSRARPTQWQKVSINKTDVFASVSDCKLWEATKFYFRPCSNACNDEVAQQARA